jgi:hypothetical protein
MRTFPGMSRGCAAVLLATLAFTGAAYGSQPDVYELDIPRQSLIDALEDFAQQTNFQVAWLAEVAQPDWMVGPVVGTHSMDEALTLLLCQWNLTYKLVNQRTLAVVPATPRACPATASLMKEM